MMKSTGPASPQKLDPEEAKRQLGRSTRRGFVIGGGLGLIGFGGWKWITSRSQEGLVPWPLRRVLEFDEKIGRALFRPSRLAPTFPASAVRMPRVNGKVGIDSKLDLERWKLQVEGPAGKRAYTLAEIKAFPRFQMTTELKCIEGWSEVVTWAGTRLIDVAEASGLARRSGDVGPLKEDTADLLSFAGLTTPNTKYFVGLDIASALHPQTLLCYEMNGEPLTLDHGAPLRLAIPVKYGIKSLKQIGTLWFTDKQPADYWAEKGYDWYSGH